MENDYGTGQRTRHVATGPFQGHSIVCILTYAQFIKDHLISLHFGTVTYTAVRNLLECVIPKIFWLQAKSQ